MKAIDGTGEKVHDFFRTIKKAERARVPDPDLSGVGETVCEFSVFVFCDFIRFVRQHEDCV